MFESGIQGRKDVSRLTVGLKEIKAVSIAIFYDHVNNLKLVILLCRYRLGYSYCNCIFTHTSIYSQQLEYIGLETNSRHTPTQQSSKHNMGISLVLLTDSALLDMYRKCVYWTHDQ